MPSYAQIADDIAIAMGFTFDDALRHREAILYNVALVVNKLKAQQLSKHAKTGDGRSNSNMLSTYIVDLQHEDVADDNVTTFDASYFDLPTSIMDLGNGGGISFVRYLRNDIPFNCPPAIARTPFTQTTLAALSSVYGSTYQRPSSRNPYFARSRKIEADTVKNRVYVFGVPISVTKLIVGLYASADFMDLDPDAPVDLPDHLLYTAKKMLLDMEAWLLQIPQERLRSDGRDFEPGERIRVSSPISVNHPSQLDE